MTKQQAQSPLDDLFRNSFENLPDTPAESGWDTPSDRVWQHVQANIQQPRNGWGTQSLVLLALIALTLTAGLYWMFSGPTEKPAATPSVAPIEQPVLTPSATEIQVNQPSDSAPKSSTGTTKSKAPQPSNSTEGTQPKPGNNTAQPLPGSKPTLPPNTTEAQKKKGEGN